MSTSSNPDRAKESDSVNEATTRSSEVYRHKARVYTKTGDAGQSSLFNQERRAKDDDLFHALGDIDELNAHVGVARACAYNSRQREQQTSGGQESASVAAAASQSEESEAHSHSQSDADAAAGNLSATASLLSAQLVEIQSRLFDLGAHVATPRHGSNAAQLRRTAFDDEHVASLERWIDAMEGSLPPLRNFILPGGGPGLSAQLHVCRAVCRRAERRVVSVVGHGDADPVVQRFLNRLSDYMFVAARFAALAEKEPETLWKKPRAKRESTTTAATDEQS